VKSSNSNTRIRTLLNELDISQTDFCNKTGLTKSALSNYLNGDRQPRQDQLDKIAKAFDLNPSWLMGYDVPMRNDEDKYYQIVIE
jgi:transcriptional regulator with XRE-family HTH domain